MGMPYSRSPGVDDAIETLNGLQKLCGGSDLGNALAIVLIEFERLEERVESAWEQAQGEGV